METARQNVLLAAHPNLRALQLQSRMERTLPPLNHEVSPPAFERTTFRLSGDLLVLSRGAMPSASLDRATGNTRAIRIVAVNRIEKAEGRESTQRSFERGA